MTNPLEDIVPASWRKKVYAILALAALIWAIYQTSEGDWTQFVSGLLVALTTATAASNTSAPFGR